MQIWSEHEKRTPLNFFRTPETSSCSNKVIMLFWAIVQMTSYNFCVCILKLDCLYRMYINNHNLLCFQLPQTTILSESSQFHMYFHFYLVFHSSRDSIVYKIRLYCLPPSGVTESECFVLKSKYSLCVQMQIHKEYAFMVDEE